MGGVTGGPKPTAGGVSISIARLTTDIGTSSYPDKRRLIGGLLAFQGAFSGGARAEKVL
jgi:hypothetical protein